uniref:FYVE-type domain-containing protein n=1 Tax=Trypanosoma vivax (strain Y486) TaxID=1055687 RepID=G0TXI9_TRYVY|nr:conserved hypothetical protein, fragment [Trypanosoma vivax Y486]
MTEKSRSSDVCAETSHVPPAFFSAAAVLFTPVTVQQVAAFSPEKLTDLTSHVMPDGSDYFGEMLLDKPHGLGIMIFKSTSHMHGSGDRYGGEWVNGVFHGSGVLITSGFTYEGSFERGKIHGRGKVTYSSSVTNAVLRGIAAISPFEQTHKPFEYTGEFHHTYHRHGRGVMLYANGDVYDGEWAMNYRNGKGTMKSGNGLEVYEGEWYNDERHGSGKTSYQYCALCCSMSDARVRSRTPLSQTPLQRHHTMRLSTLPFPLHLLPQCHAWCLVQFRFPTVPLCWSSNSLQPYCDLRCAWSCCAPLSSVSSPALPYLLPRRQSTAPPSLVRVASLTHACFFVPLVLVSVVFLKVIGTTVPLQKAAVLRLLGHVVMGHWVEDLLSCDSGSWEFPSGDLYVGSFQSGLRHGSTGRMWFSDGSYFSGRWEQDVPVGNGILYGTKEKSANNMPQNTSDDNMSLNNTVSAANTDDDVVGDGKSSFIGIALLVSMFFGKTSGRQKQVSTVAASREHYLLQNEWAASLMSYAKCQSLLLKQSAAAKRGGCATTKRAKNALNTVCKRTLVSSPDAVPVGTQSGHGIAFFKSGLRVSSDWLNNHPQLVLPHHRDAPLRDKMYKNYPDDESAGADGANASTHSSSISKVCLACSRVFAFYRKTVACALCERSYCGSCLRPIERSEYPRVESLLHMRSVVSGGITEGDSTSASQLMVCEECHQAVLLELQYRTFWLPMRRQGVVPSELDTVEPDSVAAEGDQKEESKKSILRATKNAEGNGRELLNSDENKEEDSGVKTDPLCVTNAEEEKAQAKDDVKDEDGADREKGVSTMMATAETEEYIVYEGYTSCGIPHIFGLLWWGNRDFYQGNFKKGRRHGFGQQILPNGESYTGEFSDDYWHGTGTYFCLDGTAFNGTWECGKLRTLIYHGEVDARCRPHGRGQSYLSDNNDDSRYNGEWRFGQWHGTGILHRSDGTMYSGEFAFGRIEGEGKLVDGVGVYYGTFLGGKRNGRGLELYGGERAISGEWVNDLTTGFVTISDSITKTIYETSHANGKERNDCFAPPVMVDDLHANYCAQCCALFTLFLRRHHCRLCGEIFCDSCTQRSAQMPLHFKMCGQQRVCDRCFLRLQYGRTIAIKRYVASGEVYAGCWSQGQWVSRGLFRRSDGSIVVMNAAGTPINSKEVIEGGALAEINPKSSIPDLAPAMEDIRQLPASPCGEVDAFVLWWEKMLDVANLQVPLELTPIGKFSLPRPPAAKPLKIFSEIDSTDDDAAAQRAAKFSPYVPPLPPPIPTLPTSDAMEGADITPPKRPEVTEATIFSSIQAGGLKGPLCSEMPDFTSGSEITDVYQEKSELSSSWSKKDLFPPTPQPPSQGTNEKVKWDNWGIRAVPQYGMSSLTASSPTTDMMGNSPHIPMELKHMPFACPFLLPSVYDTDRAIWGDDRPWHPEPFMSPQTFAVCETHASGVHVVQREQEVPNTALSNE